MPYIDSEDLDRLRRANEVLTQHGNLMTHALRVYAEHMTKGATAAKAEHEAGTENGLFTNDGFRQAAEILTDNAERARRAAGDIEKWETQ
ncbi:hypothetical protein AB0C10_16195 [Microbispora amethystogenes]|uniref:hypothetical protein n=1 Tax=Microbispora amethystogenes TaxID=1427754 RepID=UPI0034047435